jgi:tetrahydromethanopterin S-methyltransferase subunit A
MAHETCHACGCMHDGLARLEGVLEETGADGALLASVREWAETFPEQQVDCRGCAHWYPAEPTNIATDAVDDTRLLVTDSSSDSRAGVETDQAPTRTGLPADWPPVPGDDHAMCTGDDCPVAVSTLWDEELAEALAETAPEELCIVGRTQTENTGIEKLLRNVVGNPTIQFIVLAGPDPDGHRSGETLKALLDSGVTDEMLIADAPGRQPVLANATQGNVQTFREQVEYVDLIGCTDAETVRKTVVETAERACPCGECLSEPAAVEPTPRIEADPTERVRMDPAGYFVVTPQPEEGTVVVEHYDYDHSRQHTLEGDCADDIYRTILEREWVSQLDHAAYLGAELARAELAITRGFDYEQDGKPD